MEIDPQGLSEEAKELLAEGATNEATPCDGYIFTKILSRPSTSPATKRWWAMLTPHKAEILRRLAGHHILGPALGRVLDIPGLRSGLRRHLG